MNIILLSGGSGKRLWPLSNDVRSKQFIKIFKNKNGEYESMLQRVYRQMIKHEHDIKITIATNKSQVSSIHNQIGENVGICVEPCRKDTFPAIALAAAYLYDVEGISCDESVVVCPVDPYVEEDYFVSLLELGRQAKKGKANLTLMGIQPTYASEKYGYIIPENCKNISSVISFYEKPNCELAKEYIAKGALWNGGVFAFKLGYIIEKSHELIDYVDYYDLLSKYATLDKISFDYAVVEREKNIQVQRFNGTWKDLGTWNTFTEAMKEKTVGKAVLNDACENVHVINEIDIPILCIGIKDVVVAASPDGILVSDKESSSHLKEYTDNIVNHVMFASKSWGEYHVLDIEDDSLTIKITMRKDQRMNYHSHDHRDEVWNIVSGKGLVVVDGMEHSVKPGDVITIQAGCKHTITALTDLTAIEVQIGKDISVKDKRKYEYVY